MLRARNYAKAYKTLSVKEWNSYVVFGIQQFSNPSKYLAIRDSESAEETNLRLGRYYRLHLENNAPVDSFFMSQIAGIEAALQTSFPGYFDLSVCEMDEYVNNLTPTELHTSTGEVLHLSTPAVDPQDLLHDVEMSHNVTDNTNNDDKVSLVTKPSSVTFATSMLAVSDVKSQIPTTSDILPTTQEFRDDPTLAPFPSPTRPRVDTQETKEKHSLPSTSTSSTATEAWIRTKKPSSTAPSASFDTVSTLNRPVAVTNPVRIEARWAPKDFHALKSSTAQMYTRLAPLLSCFNTQHSWIIEWQTDQLAPEQALSSVQLSKFLSIRVVPVLAQQCFYFSFRVNANGKQLVQVLQSKELKKKKRGENLTLDPSFIPAHQGELVFIGDILLKDASVTHRSKYLKYLRDQVLSTDVPSFDIKLRHKDPAGQKTPILTVRCGKAAALSVAQSLSTALNGEGTNTEIFISSLALGANQIAKGEHEQIYKVHHDYLADVKFIPFPASRQIDTPAIEHLESGETVTRTPRQWAKSLVDDEGNSLEVDLEQGTTDGTAVLIAPSGSYSQILIELQRYWQRQNPVLATAAKLYTDTMLADPDIPMTVFTRNINTILAKKLRKNISSEGSEDAATFLSPESSITGATSKGSKGPIAWKVPLQETIQQRQEYYKASKKATRLYSNDLAAQQRIAVLEAQLSSLSRTNSKASSTSEQPSKRSHSRSRASHTSSQLSGNSPTLTIASAHARLDGIESAVMNIQHMLTTLTAGTTQVPEKASPSPAWPAISSSPKRPMMKGVQLFTDGLPSANTSLVVLSSVSTPTKNNSSKRRKPTASPDVRLQYDGSMGSSGDESF